MAPGADWKQPFEHSPFRLRFELGGEMFPNVTRPVPRFLQAFHRARTLSSAAFANADAVYAIVGDTTGDAFDELYNLGLRLPEACAMWHAPPYPDDPESPHASWRAFEVTGNAVACDTLLWASIAADMPIRPKATALIHFVSLEPEICLHVYDDRGLDIIARNQDDVEDVRSNFDHWILDFDRARIAQAFAR